MQAIVAGNIVASFSKFDSIKGEVVDFYQEKLSPADEISETSLRRKILDLYQIYKEQGQQEAIFYAISKRDLKLFLLIGFLVFILLFVNQFFVFLKDIARNFLSIRISQNISSLAFTSLLLQPLSSLRNQSGGDVITRVIVDANKIRSSFNEILESGLFSTVLIGVSFVVLFYTDYRLTLVILLAFITLSPVMFFTMQGVKKIQAEALFSLSALSTHMQSVISTAPIVKIFGRERFELGRYKITLSRFLRASFFVSLIQKIIRPITEFIGLLGVMGVILYSSYLIWDGSLLLEELFTFLFILLFVVPYMQKVTKLGTTIAVFRIHAQRILHVAFQPSEMETFSMRHKKLKNFKGAIEFRDFSFSYEQNAPISYKHNSLVLKNISLKVPAKTSIALVGKSGSGKSTLVSMLPIFYSASSGDLLFDGVSFKEFSLQSIRKNISMVSQETHLFNASVADNIRYGRLSASKQEIKEACQKAEIHGFINSLPKGYDTVIGEHGFRFSGGQRQRLSIARAFLKRSKILIFDEATSSLDSQSEQLIQQSMERIMKEQTTFIIAHRLSTILKADCIVVLSNGQIVELGTHQELLKKKGVYRNLYDIQFAGA